MREHFLRILDYLDGETYVQQDVPATTPLAVPAPIGLLGSTTLDPQQAVPLDYLHMINAHLSAMAQAPGITPDQQQLIARIGTAVNGVRDRLERVRQDARQLISMNDAQLFSQDALARLNDMMAQAFYAYTGEFDPSTYQMHGGAVQIHNDIEHLAVFAIIPYKS
jgi:hypothetical protein